MSLPLNQESNATEQSSEFYREWPQGRPALYRLSNQMVFAIPPQYGRFWIQRNRVMRAPADPKTIPEVESIAFQFFLPNFSGYTAKNYMHEFDSDQVEVIGIEPADPAQMQPDAPGYYPPNMLKRMLAAHLFEDHVRNLYGLRCYEPIGSAGKPRKLTCYGRRDEQTQEDVMLDVYIPPFDEATAFPIMQARYFADRYGGLIVVWRTHAKNFPRWREIDERIWQFIAEWSAAGSALSGSTSKQGR
jgi:hypothetical protein